MQDLIEAAETFDKEAQMSQEARLTAEAELSQVKEQLNAAQ